MDASSAIRIMQEALFTSLLVAAPLMLAVLVVGLVITILQAATQIHEMTLVFIPKMAVTYLLMLVLGNWMLFTLINFGVQIFSAIPRMIN